MPQHRTGRHVVVTQCTVCCWAIVAVVAVCAMVPAAGAATLSVSDHAVQLQLVTPLNRSVHVVERVVVQPPVHVTTDAVQNAEGYTPPPLLVHRTVDVGGSRTCSIQQASSRLANLQVVLITRRGAVRTPLAVQVSDSDAADCLVTLSFYVPTVSPPDAAAAAAAASVAAGVAAAAATATATADADADADATATPTEPADPLPSPDEAWLLELTYVLQYATHVHRNNHGLFPSYDAVIDWTVSPLTPDTRHMDVSVWSPRVLGASTASRGIISWMPSWPQFSGVFDSKVQAVFGRNRGSMPPNTFATSQAHRAVPLAIETLYHRHGTAIAGTRATAHFGDLVPDAPVPDGFPTFEDQLHQQQHQQQQSSQQGIVDVPKPAPAWIRMRVLVQAVTWKPTDDIVADLDPDLDIAGTMRLNLPGLSTGDKSGVGSGGAGAGDGANAPGSAVQDDDDDVADKATNLLGFGALHSGPVTAGGDASVASRRHRDHARVPGVVSEPRDTLPQPPQQQQQQQQQLQQHQEPGAAGEQGPLSPAPAARHLAFGPPSEPKVEHPESTWCWSMYKSEPGLLNSPWLLISPVLYSGSWFTPAESPALVAQLAGLIGLILSMVFIGHMWLCAVIPDSVLRAGSAPPLLLGFASFAHPAFGGGYHRSSSTRSFQSTPTLSDQEEWEAARTAAAFEQATRQRVVGSSASPPSSTKFLRPRRPSGSRLNGGEDGSPAGGGGVSVGNDGLSLPVAVMHADDSTGSVDSRSTTSTGSFGMATPPMTSAGHSGDFELHLAFDAVSGPDTAVSAVGAPAMRPPNLSLPPDICRSANVGMHVMDDGSPLALASDAVLGRGPGGGAAGALAAPDVDAAQRLAVHRCDVDDIDETTGFIVAPSSPPPSSLANWVFPRPSRRRRLSRVRRTMRSMYSAFAYALVFLSCAGRCGRCAADSRRCTERCHSPQRPEPGTGAAPSRRFRSVSDYLAVLPGVRWATTSPLAATLARVVPVLCAGILLWAFWCVQSVVPVCGLALGRGCPWRSKQFWAQLMLTVVLGPLPTGIVTVRFWHRFLFSPPGGALRRYVLDGVGRILVISTGGFCLFLTWVYAVLMAATGILHLSSMLFAVAIVFNSLATLWFLLANSRVVTKGLRCFTRPSVGNFLCLVLCVALLVEPFVAATVASTSPGTLSIPTFLKLQAGLGALLGFLSRSVKVFGKIVSRADAYEKAQAARLRRRRERRFASI